VDQRIIINNICNKCDVNLLLINEKIHNWFYEDKNKNLINVKTGLNKIEGTVICFEHMSEKTNDDVEKLISTIDKLIEKKITNNNTDKVKNELREILFNLFRKESDW